MCSSSGNTFFSQCFQESSCWTELHFVYDFWRDHRFVCSSIERHTEKPFSKAHIPAPIRCEYTVHSISQYHSQAVRIFKQRNQPENRGVHRSNLWLLPLVLWLQGLYLVKRLTYSAQDKLEKSTFIFFINFCYPFWFSSRVHRNRCLTLRSLTLYIYGAPILDVSRSHTTTQHSR